MANYKVVVPYFLKKEGGLSRATTDTASNNPSPCVYNGQTGWHTNKGVTWTTFKSLAPQLGYDPSCNNFLTMPADIWGLIFKKGYWNYWDGDNNPHQALADFMTWTVWGSGAAGSRRFLRNFLRDQYGINKDVSDRQGIREALISLANKDERKIWEQLIQYRWNWYALLNQPANLRGWRRSLDNYKQWGLRIYTFRPKKKLILLAGLTIAAALLGLQTLKQAKR